MAQVLKEEIDNKIVESAKKEFFENDFKTATMRNIAKGADIPVGLVYSYYKNKEVLFDKIVEPVFLVFNASLEDKNDKTTKDESLFNEMEHLIEIFKINRDGFVILIDKSKGTKYENVKSELIQMTADHIKDSMMKKVKPENDNIDEFFFHILATNFMESVFEIGRHYKSDKWAKDMLNLLVKQYFYGVNSF